MFWCKGTVGGWDTPKLPVDSFSYIIAWWLFEPVFPINFTRNWNSWISMLDWSFLLQNKIVIIYRNPFRSKSPKDLKNAKTLKWRGQEWVWECWQVPADTISIESFNGTEYWHPASRLKALIDCFVLTAQSMSPLMSTSPRYRAFANVSSSLASIP